MSISKILLADKDMEYGRAFARAVSMIHSEFEITLSELDVFNKEEMADSIEFQDFDLILTGGYSDDTNNYIQAQIADNKRIVILKDNPVASLSKQSEEVNPFWYLFKYTEISLIISDLNFLIGIMTGKKSLLKKNTAPELIGFYSISGGTGRTVISLSTSRELARYHDKKILYLSFDDLPATEFLVVCHQNNRNIGDYLYFLFEKKNELLCSRLESFTVFDEYGVETISPTGGRNDLNELTREELIQFLKIISDSCRYDFIILDLNSDLSDKTLFLLSLCRKNILVQNDDPISRFKTRKLEAYLSISAMKKIKESFILTTNNALSTSSDQEDSSTGSLPYRKEIYIERDDNSFQTMRDHMDMDITHGFGMGIAKIADEILSSGKEREICTESFAQ
jgi:cellulose biosynthesis protein BcsQ